MLRASPALQHSIFNCSIFKIQRRLLATGFWLLAGDRKVDIPQYLMLISIASLICGHLGFRLEIEKYQLVATRFSCTSTIKIHLFNIQNSTAANGGWLLASGGQWTSHNNSSIADFDCLC
ncbi:MAG: hypothetical protein JST46_05250 [Bacteroidetes bacterium]|nr:hypothetical protein [Bacteroidota bacterium]